MTGGRRLSNMTRNWLYCLFTPQSIVYCVFYYKFCQSVRLSRCVKTYHRGSPCSFTSTILAKFQRDRRYSHWAHKI